MTQQSAQSFRQGCSDLIDIQHPWSETGASLLARAIFTVVGDVRSPNLSNHMHYPHHLSITIANWRHIRLLELNNMMMKRLVGGGDDWHVHMDVMVMVPANTSTICWVLKKLVVRRIMINSTIKSTNYLGGKRVLDDRRRGMLDSARQVEAGNRQHNERGGRVTTQDKRMMDDVRQSGGCITMQERDSVIAFVRR